jgi:hypothetical protein
MKIKSILLFLFLITFPTLFAQEVLTGLQVNPAVRESALTNGFMTQGKPANDTVPVALPFMDDFSINAIFPSSERWADRFGFVNTDFPINPVNLGVVTLDAINDSGNMYPEAVPGPQTFTADHLTSRYIRLDSIFTPVPRALGPADSVYLSFYYQPQGRGSAPKTGDSLVLQFLHPAFDSITPTDTIHQPARWRNVWATKGLSLDTFYINYNRFFRLVMVPVKRERFFNKYFAFRFYNLVSLASSSEPSWQSNSAEWNIDQVYLNAGRSKSDTVYKEIRFIDRPPSMLKYYTSMPYPQFCNDPTREMIDTVAVVVRNRDTVNHKVGYSYKVSHANGTLIKSYTMGKDSTIRPYPKYNELTLRPPVPFIYPIASHDSASFIHQHFVTDKLPATLPADSIWGEQKLFNYYAYDDGTPERGYGTTRAGSRIAYQFKLNKSPDTLRAVSMFFNKTLSKGNEQYFFLTVWNDNNGKPGDTLYSRLVLVKFANTLNKFVTYHLENPLAILGTFYVGVITTTDDNLNIGFDRYNNSQENLFFNSTGQWNTSAFSGALMMRPIVGKPIPLGVQDKQIPSGSVTLFPNPSKTGSVNIRVTNLPEGTGSLENWRITVYNLYGQVLIKKPFESVLDVSGLNEGLYLVEILNPQSAQRSTAKLMIAR